MQGRLKIRQKCNKFQGKKGIEGEKRRNEEDGKDLKVLFRPKSCFYVFLMKMDSIVNSSEATIKETVLLISSVEKGMLLFKSWTFTLESPINSRIASRQDRRGFEDCCGCCCSLDSMVEVSFC